MSRDNEWVLNRLLVENFRNLPSLEIEFGPGVNLLIGRNGSGKTSVLDALAIMLRVPLRSLSGKRDNELSAEPLQFAEDDAHRSVKSLDSHEATAHVESQYPIRATLSAVIDGRELTWERTRATARNRTTYAATDVELAALDLQQRAIGPFKNGEPEEGAYATLPVIAYYGVERLVKNRRDQGKIQSSRLDAYLSALDHGSDLTRLRGFIKYLDETIIRADRFGDDEPAAAVRQFNAIDKACSSVLETAGWSQLRWDGAIGDLTLRNIDGLRQPLGRLASGPRIIAGLAIDLASRMARANPHLGADDLLEQTPGIVLIDEVDLHLHPEWQQVIVPSLEQTFPRVQLIMTTHSPQVISTVKARDIRNLADGEVSVPRFSDGLRSDVVLDEVQNVTPTPDNTAVRGLLRKYLAHVYDGAGRTTAAQEMRKILDGKGGAEKFDELRQADVHMNFERWEIPQ
ncbi:MAG: AAA family ATPase [Brevibacterium sp.]